jgi:hypothetical protein
MTSHRVRLFTAALAALMGPALVAPAVPAAAVAATAPVVRTLSIGSEGEGIPEGSFTAFPVDVSYGANVASGNLDGDAAAEIVVGTTPGSTEPRVDYRQPDGATITSFDAYGPSFAGGVFVATGNLDGDAPDEVVTGAGPSGGPHVRTFETNGSLLNNGFFAYEPGFTGGVRVAVGDVDGDGADEIVTAPASGRVATIKVFSSTGALETSFNAFDSQFLGGASVAVANLDADAADEIVVGAGPGGGPHIRVFDGNGTLKTQFFSHAAGYRGGVEVAAGNTGRTRIVVAARTDPDPIRMFYADGSESSNFDPGPSETRQYNVAVAGDKLLVADAEPALPNWQVTTAPGGGGGPHVRNRPVPSGSLTPGFMAYEESFTGGVNVARGDLDGDGIDEIVTGPAKGRAPLVKTFNADGSPRGQFLAYAAGFTGGVDVAVGDLDGDGLGEIVTAAGPGGGPHIRIFAEDGEDLTGGGFQAYAPTFHGGVRVTTGDLDGDGADEIITAPAGGGGPHVKAFVPDGAVVAQFMAYSPSFTGGVDVAAGDVDGDGAEEVITGAGPGGGPHVKFLQPDGTVVGQFMAYAPAFTGGVRVSSVDSNNDGVAEIVTGPGAGGGPHVRVLNADSTEVASYMAYAAEFRGGIDVAGGGV